MTEPGETDRMNAVDHLRAIEEHAGPGLVDCVLVSSTPPAPELLEQYAETGSELVAVEREELAACGLEVLERDLLAAGELIRHDPEKLSRAIVELVARPGAAP
jgi:2-phospho-L-lactate transferase/gluconeogenesis factor (CofD/UPF0052 family)